MPKVRPMLVAKVSVAQKAEVLRCARRLKMPWTSFVRLAALDYCRRVRAGEVVVQ